MQFRVFYGQYFIINISIEISLVIDCMIQSFGAKDVFFLKYRPNVNLKKEHNMYHVMTRVLFLIYLFK